MAKNPNFVDVHVGQRVKKRRQALGLSQEALGDGVGLTFQQIQKYEKGTNRISSSRLQQFAQILKVDVPWFFDEMPGAKKVSAKAEPLDYVDEFTAEPDAQRLMKAFMRIQDKVLRRYITRLVARLGE